jgi:hypothetical protein
MPAGSVPLLVDTLQDALVRRREVSLEWGLTAGKARGLKVSPGPIY